MHMAQRQQTTRRDVISQLNGINKKLGQARIVAQGLKPGPAGKQKGKSRIPGMSVSKPLLPRADGIGAGTGADAKVVAGATKQDLEELKTDLEEQANVAAALQTLMTHNSELQATVEEWQAKAVKASALANQVALAVHAALLCSIACSPFASEFCERKVRAS